MAVTHTVPAQPDDALDLPVDTLALRLLVRFDQSVNGAPGRATFLTGALHAYDEVGFHDSRGVLRALGEAFDWLTRQALLAQDPEQPGPACYITRRGRVVLDSADGLALLRAEERLDVDLHPLIARKVRAQFLMGEYELAAFAAMREVEIRVRDLAGATSSEIGVTLMRKAFGSTGALVDPVLDRGESEAFGALFAGAIGVFKNPSSHRQVGYADPTVAAEVILFGDLLLRLLDGTAARLSRNTDVGQRTPGDPV